MKLNFKKVLSGALSVMMAVYSIPSTLIHSEDTMKTYPYMMFAGSDIDGAITLNTDTVCINDNIATNGTIISTANNFNVNGTSIEHAEEEMIYFFKKLDYTYFNIENAETYLDDYSLEEQNIDINSGIKALEDVALSGNVENSVICSQTGDIIINTDNVNLNGIINRIFISILLYSTKQE